MLEVWVNLLTWITLSEVKVGEVDNIVVALLSLVEESEFSWSAHHIVCHHALEYKTIKEGRDRADGGMF